MDKDGGGFLSSCLGPWCKKKTKIVPNSQRPGPGATMRPSRTAAYRVTSSPETPKKDTPPEAWAHLQPQHAMQPFVEDHIEHSHGNNDDVLPFVPNAKSQKSTRSPKDVKKLDPVIADLELPGTVDKVRNFAHKTVVPKPETTRYDFVAHKTHPGHTIDEAYTNFGTIYKHDHLFAQFCRDGIFYIVFRDGNSLVAREVSKVIFSKFKLDPPYNNYNLQDVLIVNYGHMMPTSITGGVMTRASAKKLGIATGHAPSSPIYMFDVYIKGTEQKNDEDYYLLEKIPGIPEIFNLRHNGGNKEGLNLEKITVMSEFRGGQSKKYVKVLGARRLVRREGRTSYVNYKGSLIKLSDAKKMEKSTST